MNVPKLRFKEFKDEYKQLFLHDITELIKDGTHSTHQDVIEGIPLLSAKDIFDNKINIPFNTRKISKEDYNKIYANYKLKEDDILMTIVGTIGRTAIYKNENVAFQRSVATIRVKGNDPNYVRNYLESNIVSVQLLNMTNSSAQGGIYLKSLSKIRLYLPLQNEQTKVSNFLSLLDKKIELQTKKIEALKLFKKGLSNGIFSNMSIIREDDLGNICNITTGKLDANAMVENGKYRFYTCAKDFYFIDTYAFDTEALLISGNGAYVGYIHYYNGKFNAYQRTYVLDSFTYNINYIKIYLDEFLSKRISFEKKEGNTPYIVLSTLSKMKIKLTDRKTEQLIINVFNGLNNKLLLEKEKLNKLQSLKKGLIQNMFV